MNRRNYIAGIGAVGLAGTAGCLESIPFLGDDPIEFGAEPASVSQDALDETGYTEDSVEEAVVEETFEVADRTQDVVVTNWQATYDKSVSLGDLELPIDEQVRAALFTALSTPQVSVLGRTFNPVGEMSSEELAEMVQDRYEGMDDIERVGEREATVLGESTMVGEFETEAELAPVGSAVPLTLQIAEAVESADDLVVGVGGYPTALAGSEEANIFTLLGAIEHPV